MPLSDEISSLHDLHQRGALTDEEFSRAKQRVLQGAPEQGSAQAPMPTLAAINSLRRSRSDRWIAGVCGGIAHATHVESWVWRLVFAALLLCGGAGLLIYVLMWIFVPSE